MLINKIIFLSLPILSLALMANYTHAVSCSVNTDPWDSGYTASVTVTNDSSSAISGWKVNVNFDSSPNIHNKWGAILNVSGNTVRAENFTWNSDLAPGESVIFGMQGAHDGNFSKPSCSVRDLRYLTLRSYRQQCMTLGWTLCYVEEDGSFIYQGIEGFRFVWGHSYELLVEIIAVENPAADAPDSRYVLAEVISDTEDSVGTTYEFPLFGIDIPALRKHDGSYYFMGQKFTCSNGIDCDVLIASGYSDRIVFKYLGNDEVALISWN